jgi:hypothetical protein
LVVSAAGLVTGAAAITTRGERAARLVIQTTLLAVWTKFIFNGSKERFIVLGCSSRHHEGKQQDGFKLHGG